MFGVAASEPVRLLTVGSLHFSENTREILGCV